MNYEKSNIEQNLSEESLVSDLNHSLDNIMKDASDTVNEFFENLEFTIQDNELREETKEILKTFSKGLRESVELTSNKLNNKIISKNNATEEE